MDQAKPASEELSGHFDERSEDPALDRLMCLSGSVVPEVPVENWSFIATHVADFTAKFVRTARFDEPISTARKTKAFTS